MEPILHQTELNLIDNLNVLELNKDEKLMFYDCTSTPILQTQGHVGLSGPPIYKERYNDLDDVRKFVTIHGNESYCSVTAHIKVEINNIIYYRYIDLFLKDDSFHTICK